MFCEKARVSVRSLNNQLSIYKSRLDRKFDHAIKIMRLCGGMTDMKGLCIDMINIMDDLIAILADFVKLPPRTKMFPEPEAPEPKKQRKSESGKQHAKFVPVQSQVTIYHRPEQPFKVEEDDETFEFLSPKSTCTVETQPNTVQDPVEEDESMKWCNQALKKISQYMQAKALKEMTMQEMETNAASLPFRSVTEEKPFGSYAEQIKQPAETFQEPQNFLRHGYTTELKQFGTSVEQRQQSNQPPAFKTLEEEWRYVIGMCYGEDFEERVKQLTEEARVYIKKRLKPIRQLAQVSQITGIDFTRIRYIIATWRQRNFRIQVNQPDPDKGKITPEVAGYLLNPITLQRWAGKSASKRVELLYQDTGVSLERPSTLYRFYQQNNITDIEKPPKARSSHFTPTEKKRFCLALQDQAGLPKDFARMAATVVTRTAEECERLYTKLRRALVYRGVTLMPGTKRELFH